MKKIIITALLLFTFASFAMSQDLLIRYDFVNKNVYFFKIRQHKGVKKLIPMRHPRIGANRNVKIEYVNINPFIWDQPRLNLVSVVSDSISSFNPMALLMPSSMSSGLGGLNLGGTRDAGPLTPKQQMCESCLRSLYETHDQITALKFNYKLTKQQILDQSRDKIRKLIKSCGSPVGIDTSTSDFKPSDFAALKAYFKEICPLNVPVTSRGASDSKVDSFLGTSGVSANTQELLPNDAVSKIEENYSTVSDADFIYENSFIVSDKDVVLHMDFNLTDEYRKKASKDSASAEKRSKHPLPVRDESIFIPVKGGLRISNSAGIGFTYVGAARKTYFVDDHDSTLKSNVDNRIVPVIASFINAYSRGFGVVNVGGSFGIGVAFMETLSINFMFGATAIFGRKERLLLSGGFVLSPVTVPDKGYYVGKHTTNPDFPTKMTYKPGVFFTIHYNLGKY